MNRLQIREKIHGFLVDEFEFEADIIQDDAANMQDTLQLDSLDYVDLFAAIENEFGVKLKIEDFSTIESFNDLYIYIENKLQ